MQFFELDPSRKRVSRATFQKEAAHQLLIPCGEGAIGIAEAEGEVLGLLYPALPVDQYEAFRRPLRDGFDAIDSM